MANAVLTPTAVTREVLRVLHNNLTFAKNVNRQYDDQFAKTGAKIGDSLKIRLPNKYTIRTGKNLAAQDTNESSVTLTCATQIGIDMTFSTAELTMQMDDFSKRIIEPAAARIASEIDRLGMAEYYNVNNRVGTAGTTPAAALVWLQGGQKLDEMATPRDNNRHAVMNPAAMAATVNGLTGLFQSSDRISSQYEKGMMGQGLGFNFWMDQNVPILTTGTRAGTILTDTALPTEGTNVLHIDGLTNATDTIKQGETFTIADVYAVNPETGESTGSLQVFTVLSDATAASNEVDLTVYPSFTASGAGKTINALPLVDKAVTFYGSASTQYAQNLVMHRDAFVLATADLEDVSKYGAWGSRESVDGISIRLARQYDINSDNVPCRLDVLFGWKCVRPEMACRVSA
jgi:hypothetical protein